MALTKKQRAAALKNLAKARAARRRKSHPKRKASKAKATRTKGARKRRARRALKASGRIRPVVIVSGGKYHRPKGSHYFSKPTKINRRRKYRRNPAKTVAMVKSIFTMRSLTRILSVGGGVLGGGVLIQFLTTGMLPLIATPLLPASITAPLSKARPGFGLIAVLAGMYMQKRRSPIAKDVGVGIAALGGYDLLVQILRLVGVSNLPMLSGMNVSPYLGMNVQSYLGENVTIPNYLGENVDMNLSQSPFVLAGENAPSMDDMIAI